MIEIPILGKLERDQFDDWLRSKSISVNVLGGRKFEFILEGYEEDEAKEEFHIAIKNFLSLEESVLKKAQNHIFQYYRDVISHLEPDDDWFVEIQKPEEVWEHIQITNSPMVKRRPYGDKRVYISLECSCDWEQEHGLQVVFKQGLLVNKISSYDGHLTNSDAYAEDKLENVVYHKV